MLPAKKTSQRTMIAMTVLCAALIAMPTAWGQASQAASAPAPSTSAVSAKRQIRTLDSIVAVVNKEVITRRELDDRISVVENRIKAEGSASLPPRSELEKQVLEMMIVESAQMQLAKELGIQVDDIILDRAIARIAEQNKLTMQELRNQLERDGVTFASFRENIRGEIVRQRLREHEVDNKIQIAESEVENYLAAQSGTTQSTELDIAQILVRIPENASSEQIADRQKRAEELYKKLRAGADFATLATTSSDASDALKGGDLGWRTADRLPQLFLDAIAKLKPGEVSEIVKSANGFHILKFVGKRNPSAASGGAAATTAIQQTHARHILIKVNQVVSSADAQRKLNDLKERLDHHAAKFEDLAKAYSNDLSASKGGDLGWIYPGDTVPEFERAMNALKVGEVSQPIESPFGYHLIQVLERKTTDMSDERQRSLARQAIRDRKLEEATQDWLRQVRDRAYVEYHLDEK
ncbi:MAG TPA: peptidylprolyl isomerase [Burkholderiaceae bacterium]|jgi:peptidyl-prolyl cis-trans isomerase SurA